MHLLEHNLALLQTTLCLFFGSSFLDGTALAVQLRVIESCRCFVGDEDVPLKEVGFDFLHVGEHFFLGILLTFESCHYVLDLLLVLLLSLHYLLSEKAEYFIHVYIYRLKNNPLTV